MRSSGCVYGSHGQRCGPEPARTVVGAVIVGETVRVWRPTGAGEDAHGNETIEWSEPEDVEDVIVAPGPRTDLPDPSRPDGDRVEWTLHFPKGYPATLRNAIISVRAGEPLRVKGDPQHYTEENTPGRWSMPVELWRIDG